MGRITLDDVQWLHQFYTACEVTLRQSYRDNPRATVWCAAARDFYKAIYQHAEREYQAQRARDRRRHWDKVFGPPKDHTAKPRKLGPEQAAEGTYTTDDDLPPMW